MKFSKLFFSRWPANDTGLMKAAKESDRMSFRRQFIRILAIAGFAFTFAGSHQSTAQSLSAKEQALIKTAKFACYEAYGGANSRTDIKSQMNTLEKILARNRASSLSRLSQVGSLTYYYGMVPMERYSSFGKTWERVHLGVQKKYVFVGSKCPVFSSTALDEFMKIQCKLPGCRLVGGWQKMVIRSTDAPG
jgi:hypothetical protein